MRLVANDNLRPRFSSKQTAIIIALFKKRHLALLVNAFMEFT